MASTRAGHATTRSPRYALGPGAELPIARIVAVSVKALTGRAAEGKTLESTGAKRAVR